MIVQQKLGLDSFKKLAAQVKTEGVHIVVSDGVDAKTRIITQEQVLSKVTDVFNLGKKLDVRTTLGVGKHHSFRFEQFNNVFYLVRKSD